MSQTDPVKLTLWAALNSIISTSRFLGLMQTGKLIAATLEGNTTQERLAQFELGLENREVVPGKVPGTQYVLLKHCPFREVYDNIPEWSQDATKLVANYNQNPTEGGGGALHPLCIVHRGIRENMPTRVTNLACRSESTNAIVISEANLAAAALTREEAAKMIADHACLYCIHSK